MGQPASVIALLTEVVNDQRAGNRTETATYIESLRMLAQAHTRSRDARSAAPLYDEALQKNIALYGEENPITPRLLGGIASTYAVLGRKHEAVQLYRRVIQLGRKIHGDVHTLVSIATLNLADHYYLAFGDTKQAEYWLRKSLETCPPEARGNCAMSERQLGEMLLIEGKLFEAIYHLERSRSDLLSMYTYGEQIDNATVNLAHAHLRRYDFDQAAPLLTGSLLNEIRTIEAFRSEYLELIVGADKLSQFFGWNRQSDGSTIVPPLKR
jgi:tetratricopeptide (TPR) repeat protein